MRNWKESKTTLRRYTTILRQILGLTRLKKTIVCDAAMVDRNAKTFEDVENKTNHRTNFITFNLKVSASSLSLKP